MSLLINIAAQFSGKKALKDAQKQVNVLEQSAKKLGSTLGVSLSTAAVVAFGKASVKAFMDDEKSAAILSNTLKNLGLAFADLNIKTFIDQLALASGVADDELRPAFQRLLQATKSLSQSQSLLQQSLDFARGSGQSLETVVLDIANAYVGNNKGLKKYTLGLTAAELKTASFDKVLAAFNKNFSGANQAYLKTYAGQMGVLTVAAAEAKEVIGKGLVDSLALLGEDNSVTDLSKAMSNLADFTADTVYGLASMTAELKKLGAATPSWFKSLVGSFAKSTPVATALGAIKGIANYGERKQNQKLENASVQMFKTDMANFRLGKEKAKNDKKIIAAQKALTAEQKKQAALKKAGSIFDQEQIQIIAALKGKLSDEDRKRVELQLALQTENVSEAQKLTYEIAKSQGLSDALAKSLASLPAASNPFAAWKGYLDEIELQAKRIASFGTGATTSMPPATSGNFAAETQLPSTSGSASQFGSNTPWAQAAAGSVYVQIDGKTIASALIDQSLSGNQAYANRRTGGFE